MIQKQIVNGFEFEKISPAQVEKIVADCRQERSDYILNSSLSVAGSLMNLVRSMFRVPKYIRLGER